MRIDNEEVHWNKTNQLLGNHFNNIKIKRFAENSMKRQMKHDHNCKHNPKLSQKICLPNNMANGKKHGYNAGLYWRVLIVHKKRKS